MLVEMTHPGISLDGTAGFLAGQACRGGGQLVGVFGSTTHCRRDEFFFTYDYGSYMNVAMADGSVRSCGPATVRPMTCESCCKSAALRKKRLATQAASELAQHRRPGRVAAFGRHAADVAVRSRKVLSVPPPPS